MASGRQTSGRSKQKKANKTTEDEQAIVKCQQEQLDKLEKENQMFKEREELNLKRAALVVHSKKNAGQKKAMMGLLRKIVTNKLWKRCKFIKNDWYFFKACTLVVRKLNLQETEGLKGKELEAAERMWIEASQQTFYCYPPQ